MSYNSHHWQNSSIVTVELYNIRYQSGYEKYIIELGYGQGTRASNPKVTLVESRGINHSARIVLGTPEQHTTSYGGHPNFTISIYADVRHYATYVTKITHIKNRVSSFNEHNQIIINEAPIGVNTDDFTLPKPSYNLTNGNVGIGTENPDAKIHIRDYMNTASFPSQTSRGDISQLITNTNNSLEFGLAGASNTRRSWILSRHSDISGTYGKYYNTLHLQPDTGDKSQYRGIAIGYPANEHINIGTHLAVNGNVGIGTKDPTAKIHAEVDSENTRGSYTAKIINKSNKNHSQHSLYLQVENNGGDLLRASNNGGSSNETFAIKNNGNVGIGILNPDSKLAVNGTIHTKEVKVDLNGWSDFVFYNNYKLPTLSEVENHIKTKGHLKDIPSAKEVSKNGVLLGQMDAKLLQKIEELTLYTIAQEKEIKTLKNTLNTILKQLEK